MGREERLSRFKKGEKCAFLLLGLQKDGLFFKPCGLCDLACLFRDVLVYKEEGGVRLLYGVGKVLRRPIAVKGNKHTAHREDGKIGKHPLIRKLTDEGAVLAVTSHIVKGSGEGAHIVS